jgi:hypothetical protein
MVSIVGFTTRFILTKCDVAPPMLDSAYYAIPDYAVADTIKIKFLFLFLPRKEKIKEAIGVQYWWSVLSLKKSGWGPPSCMLKMAVHLQKCPLFILVCCFIFYLGKVGPNQVIFIFLVSFACRSS